MAASVEELNSALADFEPIAARIGDLKAETARMEAEILEQIIIKVTPLIPLIGRQGESYYRRDIILATRSEAAPQALDKVSRFYSEHNLVLYETGQLWGLHRFGEASCMEGRPGWELNEEHELLPREAVAAFGLPAIVAGLIETLREAKSRIILGELEARTNALTKILEALT